MRRKREQLMFYQAIFLLFVLSKEKYEQLLVPPQCFGSMNILMLNHSSYTMTCPVRTEKDVQGAVILTQETCKKDEACNGADSTKCEGLCRSVCLREKG